MIKCPTESSQKLRTKTIQLVSNGHVNGLWLGQQQVDLLPWRGSLTEFLCVDLFFISIWLCWSYLCSLGGQCSNLQQISIFLFLLPFILKFVTLNCSFIFQMKEMKNKPIKLIRSTGWMMVPALVTFRAKRSDWPVGRMYVELARERKD